ncbi:hypothetical protein SAMN05720470_105101 [Fibrobacter sp. UWOV1]|uniref:hypothetical protein n=1 Tax=Fibrobacter sp. UWOV1 TaxID=1896215 RepID=UPI00091A345E|nr:hypothetical protein [Fibrobacter sp. UWOV1]SHL15833.1 hypothetical protein SAMN05720470_105101 [Fibrobacter sp. UWOV1]
MRNLNENFYFWDVLKDTPANMAKFAVTSILALSFGLGLVACGETKTAGGGPSGTEAGNAITAQILTAEKSPAALAKVRLMDSEALGDEKAYSAEADKDGNVTIEGVEDGDYTLEAKLAGEALQIPVQVNGASVDLGKDRLKKTATVSGSVGDKSLKGVVKVRGLEHSAKVKDGNFTLDSLPEGVLSLVFIPDVEDVDTSSTYLKVLAGESTVSGTFADESRALLLEDFQDSNYQNRFMPARTYDGGWWYYDFADNVTPDFIIGENHLFTLANEDGNISAHVAAHFGDIVKDSSGVAHWPWATMGVELGKSDKALCNDISSVDSVAFRIKGIGSVVFNIIDSNLKPDHQKLIQSEYGLDSVWVRVSVPLPADKAAFKCVNQLAWDFKTIDGYAEVWLDDVELIGGDRLSIWEK